MGGHWVPPSPSHVCPPGGFIQLQTSGGRVWGGWRALTLRPMPPPAANVWLNWGAGGGHWHPPILSCHPLQLQALDGVFWGCRGSCVPPKMSTFGTSPGGEAKDPPLLPNDTPQPQSPSPSGTPRRAPFPPVPPQSRTHRRRGHSSPHPDTRGWGTHTPQNSPQPRLVPLPSPGPQWRPPPPSSRTPWPYPPWGGEECPFPMAGWGKQIWGRWRGVEAPRP